MLHLLFGYVIWRNLQDINSFRLSFHCDACDAVRRILCDVKVYYNDIVTR